MLSCISRSLPYSLSPSAPPPHRSPAPRALGATTPGGRGGRVLFVTNLNDSGPGSFRAAAEAEGPRIVVFRAGGIIDLKSNIRVTHPFLTVAGQTAPGTASACATTSSRWRRTT